MITNTTNSTAIKTNNGTNTIKTNNSNNNTVKTSSSNNNEQQQILMSRFFCAAASTRRVQTTAKQTVLYNLFDWPSRTHARVVVVGIANTMDLPERCLPRVSSRITARLAFKPYNKLQVGETTR